MHVLSNPRKAVLEYGMFDQIRVDGGKEFFLVLGKQEQLQDLRVITLYLKSRNLCVTNKVYRKYIVRKAVKYA